MACAKVKELTSLDTAGLCDRLGLRLHPQEVSFNPLALWKLHMPLPRLRADGDVQKDWKSVDAVVLALSSHLTCNQIMDHGHHNVSIVAEVIEGMLPPGAGVKLKTLLDVPTGRMSCRNSTMCPLPWLRLMEGVLCKAGPNVPEGAEASTRS